MSYRIINGQMYSVGKVGQGSTLQEKIDVLKPQSNNSKRFKIAEDKNSKNTVMLYKNVALIASVENRTLITAVDKNRTNENIFTNIDSVVLL